MNSSDNQKFEPFLKIDNPQKKNRYVISDIHGFYDTFCALLETIQLKKHDQLFLLGDFIDKGKKGKEILDKIISLIKDDFQIYPLRGNHEDMLLRSHYSNFDNETIRIPILRKSKGIRDSQHKIFPEYLNFFEKLPFYYELDKFLLVHAGFNFSSPNPFTDYKSMMWTNEFEYNSKLTSDKTIIHGHSGQKLSKIIDSVKKRNNIIGIDNLTFAKGTNDFGNMVCLNIDSFELFIQPNIDS
jgi:serine/threonine protein phosphatase 1